MSFKWLNGLACKHEVDQEIGSHFESTETQADYEVLTDESELNQLGPSAAIPQQLGTVGVNRSPTFAELVSH